MYFNSSIQDRCDLLPVPSLHCICSLTKRVHGLIVMHASKSVQMFLKVITEHIVRCLSSDIACVLPHLCQIIAAEGISSQPWRVTVDASTIWMDFRIPLKTTNNTIFTNRINTVHNFFLFFFNNEPRKKHNNKCQSK